MSTSSNTDETTILQAFGSLQPVRIGLSAQTRHHSVRALNRLLAHSMAMRDLLEAHEFLLNEARPLAREASEHSDDGTNDLIVGGVIRTNELQAWFVGEHLAGESNNGTVRT
jgi:hypothetical protein